MNNKDVENDKIKIWTCAMTNDSKSRKENKISSLEQNGLVDWAKWKWKKPKYGIFSHISKRLAKERYCHLWCWPSIIHILTFINLLIDTMKAEIKWSRSWITVIANSKTFNGTIHLKTVTVMQVSHYKLMYQLQEKTGSQKHPDFCEWWEKS